jgi:hypothetical protein
MGPRGWGIRRIRDEAVAIDANARRVKLARGPALPYDRLIPFARRRFHVGADPSLADPEPRAKVLHAWKAGPQTLALRRQLETMPDGGVFAIHIPSASSLSAGPLRASLRLVSGSTSPRGRGAQSAYPGRERRRASRESLCSRRLGEGRYQGLVDRPDSELVDVDVATPDRRARVRRRCKPTCSTSSRRNAPARLPGSSVWRTPATAFARSTP